MTIKDFKFTSNPNAEKPTATCSLSYDKKKNEVYIDAPESAFVPKYLDYLLEYLKIPKSAKRYFSITEDKK